MLYARFMNINYSMKIFNIDILKDKLQHDKTNTTRKSICRSRFRLFPPFDNLFNVIINLLLNFISLPIYFHFLIFLITNFFLHKTLINDFVIKIVVTFDKIVIEII